MATVSVSSGVCPGDEDKLTGYATVLHWDCDRIMKSSTTIMVFHAHHAWDYTIASQKYDM